VLHFAGHDRTPPDKFSVTPARGTVSASDLQHSEHWLRVDQTGEIIMADTIREKIENAGEAAKDAAKKAGEKVKEGAETVAEKTAKTAKSVGQAAKDAGQKLKDKSGA
jgi:hypothetical protein